MIEREMSVDSAVDVGKGDYEVLSVEETEERWQRDSSLLAVGIEVIDKRT
jgi:hypothetical protein